MRRIGPRLFVPDGGLLSEGPFWFEDRLWWVDVEGGMLNSVGADGRDRRSLALGWRVGAAAPVAGGEWFVVALENGIYVLNRNSGAVSIVANPEKDISGNRFNDGKCDPAGRFVAGTLNMRGGKDAAALYCLDQAGIRNILSPVTLSNGLAWSEDGRTFYHIDTPTREIAAFTYDAGALRDRRVVVSIEPEMGLPDGMDIDREGNLWVAHWGGAAVRCWSPRTGRCLAEVALPALRPTSCCFGGSGLDRLFITTAKIGGAENEAETFPLSGGIFACEPGVTGHPVRVCSAFPWS